MFHFLGGTGYKNSLESIRENILDFKQTPIKLELSDILYSLYFVMMIQFSVIMFELQTKNLKNNFEIL